MVDGEAASAWLLGRGAEHWRACVMRRGGVKFLRGRETKGLCVLSVFFLLPFCNALSPYAPSSNPPAIAASAMLSRPASAPPFLRRGNAGREGGDSQCAASRAPGVWAS